MNPKEYCEKFNDYSDNKKHKGLKKLTPGMDIDFYSSCLADLTEYYDQFCRPLLKKIQQKRFQIINELMQMSTISKVQFGTLNSKKFYFCDGIVSLPYGHQLLENLRKKKLKNRKFIVLFKQKKKNFCKKKVK